jgi:hypothetical protein
MLGIQLEMAFRKLAKTGDESIVAGYATAFEKILGKSKTKKLTDLLNDLINTSKKSLKKTK